MDTQDQQYEQQFTKGFNNGYLLTKHEPDLAAQLSAHTNDHNAYFKGLISGKQEYEKEIIEWSKSFSKGGQTNDDREADRNR